MTLLVLLLIPYAMIGCFIAGQHYVSSSTSYWGRAGYTILHVVFWLPIFILLYSVDPLTKLRDTLQLRFFWRFYTRKDWQIGGSLMKQEFVEAAEAQVKDQYSSNSLEDRIWRHCVRMTRKRFDKQQKLLHASNR